MVARAHRSSVIWLAAVASRGGPLSAASVDLAKHRGFADGLTALLYKKENECTSTLGVSMAFSLIYPGCTSDGVDQVRNTFGYPAGTNMQLVWDEASQRMLESAGGQCMGGESQGACYSAAPLLKIANSIWLDDGDTLSQEYQAVVGEYVKQIDLEAQDSPITVNEWVSESTNGLIKTIVDEGQPIKPPIELIAINSIYLKAAWTNQFDEEKTNLDSFYSSASKTDEVAKAHFMNRVFDGLPYSHDALPGRQVVKLPFAESQMSMIFVLPMADGVEPVKSEELLPALANLEQTRLALSVPKFKFESEYSDDLKKALIQSGVSAPFSGGSLCGIFQADLTCENLVIDEIIQKTVIDVNELGVEAAAVTAVMMGRSQHMPREEPTLMACDRPFQFFIHEGGEDLVLFEGRLGKPEVSGDASAALGSRRSEPGFWSEAFGVEPVDPPAYEARAEAPPGSSSAAGVCASLASIPLILAVAGGALMWVLDPL